MGDEARCSARHRNQISAGKAFLETDELRFRGDFRLVIPLRDIRAVSVVNGALNVKFGDESATFELGKAAERWAEKIRTPRTLLDKLGVKADSRVSVVDVDDSSFRALLRERGTDATEGPARSSDLIVFQANAPEDLDRLSKLAESLKPNGGIWVVAPKGGREPREAQVLDAGKRAGLVDVKVARFSDTHTAHKFVIPLARRSERARSGFDAETAHSTGGGA
jgi:hypothetical protein